MEENKGIKKDNCINKFPQRVNKFALKITLRRHSRRQVGLPGIHNMARFIAKFTANFRWEGSNVNEGKPWNGPQNASSSINPVANYDVYCVFLLDVSTPSSSPSSF
ncbi:hypothetical protein CEXT_529871 [Caerostris extrusa]|uniref:Uncharacterized protein n=1 Tax=Caerostris extrusa TaxID=172846 RepID=A0AAV4YC66_CAEEX|nr:hypothetical protein CEXT_529871 [Caerostris extrusa]